MVCQDVNAETVYTEGALKYVIRDNEIVIIKYFGLEEEVTIPRIINNIPVTSIAAGAFADSAAVTVIIPDSIAYIEEGAFSSDITIINEEDIEDEPDDPINPEKKEEGQPIVEGGEETADISIDAIEKGGEVGEIDSDNSAITNKNIQNKTDDHRISEAKYNEIAKESTRRTIIIYAVIGACVILIGYIIVKKIKNSK